MKIVIKKDYEALSQYAAAKFLGYMTKEGRVNIAPTAGTTPKRMYEIINSFINNNEPEFIIGDVHYYQQDNFLSTKRPEVPSLFPEIDQMFFIPAQVPKERIEHLTFATYENAYTTISRAGGFDFTLMGLGSDGHFAANMPGTKFGKHGYIETFTGEMQAQMAEMFGVPDGDTWSCLGPELLLSLSKDILLIVTGTGKADILQQIVEGPIDEAIPASVLRMHPNFTIVCDEAAAQNLSATIKKLYE
jgi:6-phosphogluconolactonase/Glucosamine-6-phosphate isomerase/deaminase